MPKLQFKRLHEFSREDVVVMALGAVASSVSLVADEKEGLVASVAGTIVIFLFLNEVARFATNRVRGLFRIVYGGSLRGRELFVSFAELLLPSRVFSEDFLDLLEAYDQRSATRGVWFARLWLTSQLGWMVYCCVRNPPKVGDAPQKDNR